MTGEVARVDVRPAHEPAVTAVRGAAARPETMATDSGRSPATRQPGNDRARGRPQAAELQAAASKLNRAAAAFDVQARFSVHKATGQILVKIVNTRTGQVLREIPPERMLDLASSMEHMLGLVVDAKA
ncbi:MAG: flagellar protein FlaG [Symbiobacteriia bacterium]